MFYMSIWLMISNLFAVKCQQFLQGRKSYGKSCVPNSVIT